MHRLQHVTLIVADLRAATDFYTGHFGFREIEKQGLDYPGAFLRVNEYAELHLAQIPDVAASFRGHFCLRIDNFNEHFYRFQRLGLLDTEAWGKMRELADGAVQMYIRDPSGNLVELTSHPQDRHLIDPAILEGPEWGGRPFKLHRGTAGEG